ncbi:MAG TPA: nucleotidyltransferase domain-containing protein [Anaerolineae bacterium]|nr:nucleotidyltransferase domain-containing protein [Anaerolineae bacterium]HMR64778.1 nucleotidyltransferase domain-containing protein [Anaerolineae bacterium]
MTELTVLSQTELYEVLDEYRRRLLEALPGEIERLILFGSYARGDARSESDIDVLVVVNWPQERLPDGFYASFYSDPRWQKIVDIATDMMLEKSVFISPTVFSKYRMTEPLPLLHQIKREGIELWPHAQSSYYN